MLIVTNVLTLYGPYKQWEEICEDDELRAYVNVLEDTRIDKLIKKNTLVLLKTIKMVLIY